MRITEHRMIDLAAAGTARAQERLAEATETMSSGLRVERPSQDPAAWVEGQRATARRAASETRGSAIARTSERLDATDGALATIGSVLTRARELAIQGANGTYGPDGRAAMAAEVAQMREAALAAANSRGGDGEYLLAGSRGDVAPFTAAGLYVGDDVVRSIESSEAGTQQATVPGSVLTASSGVDVLGVLDSLTAALNANDVTGVRGTLDDIDTAIGQVSSARSDGGALSAAFAVADEARTALELRITGVITRAVEADPFAAASELAKTSQALQVATTVSANVIAMVRPR